ncbi:MAG: HU family DNA-binding protein [Clostridia bacterium]
MNKTNLIDIVADQAGLKKKESEAAVNAVFEAIVKDLAEGGKVQIAGFGSFKVKERSARIGRNPKTLEEIQIPASKAPSFVAGKGLKDAINK